MSIEKTRDIVFWVFTFVAAVIILLIIKYPNKELFNKSDSEIISKHSSRLLIFNDNICVSNHLVKEAHIKDGKIYWTEVTGKKGFRTWNSNTCDYEVNDL